jgi:hypothetical protein
MSGDFLQLSDLWSGKPPPLRHVFNLKSFVHKKYLFSPVWFMKKTNSEGSIDFAAQFPGLASDPHKHFLTSLKNATVHICAFSPLHSFLGEPLFSV